MKPPEKKEQPLQIQLELPDYSQAYYDYVQKKEKDKEAEETVAIIDIY